MGIPSTASRTLDKMFGTCTGMLMGGVATVIRILVQYVVMCPLLWRLPRDQYPPNGGRGALGDGLLRPVKSNAKVCHALSCSPKSPVVFPNERSKCN